MDLNGTLGNTGIPKRIALPLGAAVLAGGYIFYKRYKTAKAATTATASTAASATGTGSLAGTTAYGPYGGDNSVAMQTTNSGFGDGQYAALGTTATGIVAQNQAISAAIAEGVDQEVTTNKALASLLAVNPGAMAQFKQLPPNSVYEKQMQSNMAGVMGQIFPGTGSIVPGGVGS